MLPDRELPIDRHMTYGQMRWAIDPLPVTVFSMNLPGNIMGLYKESTQTIAIDLSLTYRQKKCTLVHELFHWANGDKRCNSVYDCRDEKRTRLATARLLISQDEYATLERMYDGDTWRMAGELDVTMQVINDYRTWLQNTIRR